MSEPLSTTEIEDVLSSIRRLVAEDMRPQPPAKPAPVEVARNKLILTPALRVVTSEGDAGQAADMAVVVSNLGSGLAPAEWEPEGSETADLDAGFDGDAAQDLADHAWAFESDAADGADDAIVFLASEPASSEVETPDYSPEEPTEAPTFVSVRRSDPVDDVPGWAQAEELGDMPDDPPTSDAAPLEAVIGTIEPDPEWADAAEADVLAELEQDAVADAQPAFEAALGPDLGDAGEFDAEEPLYDEALLREIVRDLLREELQGAMGERITRNIRKLVRAEIARAFATQDLT